MVRPTVLDEYETGWQAVRGSDNFYSITSSEEITNFGSSSVGSNRKRVRLYTALCVKLGSQPLLEDPKVIPVDVGAAGKPEIAAYLWAVHREHYTPEDSFKPKLIGDQIGINYNTVSKYCRRVIRSVEEFRVGGTSR